MFDRRLIQNFDWGLIGVTCLLISLGLVTLHSAVSAGTSMPHLYVKQLIWYCAGVTLMSMILLIDYKSIKRWAYVLYSGCIFLLICVSLFGRYIGGSKRWLAIGAISIQPSELVKLAMIIVLARYYSQRIDTEGFSLRELIGPVILTIIPFMLIVKQPDLGTAMIVFLIAASITLFVKIKIWTFLCIIIAGLIAAPPVWFCLKGYQRQRILTFLNPDLDPLGAGYHIIQSKIAIGSGMITGKGLTKGSQNILSFIPEHHTDFIFSVLAEELGFAGSIVAVIAFLILIIWALNIAYRCKDPFGIILSVGISIMIFWQVFINVGMVMGVMPVVGVPLPFISYGGSSTITMMISIGILLNISMRRFMFEGKR